MLVMFLFKQNFSFLKEKRFDDYGTLLECVFKSISQI